MADNAVKKDEQHEEKPSAASSGFGLEEIWKDGERVERLNSTGTFLHLAGEAVKSIAHSPFTSLVTVSTVAISLFTLGVFLLIVHNVNDRIVGSRTDIRLTVFLDERTPPSRVPGFLSEIKELPEVARAEYRDKSAALEEFSRMLGENASVLEGLEENPLPASIEVTFRDGQNSSEVFARFENTFEDSPFVDRIVYSEKLLANLAEIVSAFRFAGLILILVALMVTAFIIATTITLALNARKDEIYIMRLMGASHWFVRLPCLIEGFFQGFCGALLSLVLLFFAHQAVRDSIGRSELFQHYVGSISYLSPFGVVLVLMSGIAVGVLGSYLAVRRFSNA